jgi:prepilin-type N-terminal cleavage/methylation domain-containing protein
MTRKRDSHKTEDGFSLIELMVVVTITVVVAAGAVPQIVRVLGDVKVHTTAAMVRAAIRDTRMRAVRDDTAYSVYLSQTANGLSFYIDDNRNQIQDATETATVASGIVLAAGSTAPGPFALDFSPQAQASSISFNARGVPCVRVGQSCATVVNGQVVGFLVLLRHQPALGGDLWSAVSISPSGRIQVWTWAANRWQEA